MSIAPEPIRRAGNETVYWACVYCRSQTYGTEACAKVINELMDAIHEVPRMLVNWERHDLKIIRNHLGCFTASRWRGTPDWPPNAPDLVAYFDERLRRYGFEENAD